MTSLVFATPWLILLMYLALRMRLPKKLGPEGVFADDAPLVSIIIPARNEERNVLVSAESVGASTYPNFELIVVDGRISTNFGLDSSMDLTIPSPDNTLHV